MKLSPNNDLKMSKYLNRQFLISVLRILFNFDADSDPLSALENISAIFTDFFYKAELSNNFSSFGLLKHNEPFRDQDIFIISLFQQFRIGF